MSHTGGQDRLIGRREFAGLAGSLGAVGLMPFNLMGDLDRRHVVLELIDMTEESLPGNGTRQRCTVRTALPGHHEGTATVVNDVWKTDEGFISYRSFHVTPEMTAFDGYRIREGHIRSEFIYGEPIDEEYRETLIKMKATIPGREPLVIERRIKHRINRKLPLDVAGEMKKIAADISDGVWWEDAIKNNISDAGNSIPIPDDA